MNWPKELLPAPSVQLKFQDDSSLVSNRMDSGVLRQRQRFTATARTFEVTLILDFFEMGIFEAFYQQAIFNGAGRFTMDLPLPGFFTLQEVEVQIINGTKSSAALAGNEFWEVTFSLFSDFGFRVYDDLYAALSEFSIDEIPPFAVLSSELYEVLNTLPLN